MIPQGMQAGSSIIGTASPMTAGIASARQATQDRETSFNHLNNHLSAIIDRLATIEARLGNFCERVNGPVPTKGSEASPQPPVSSFHLAKTTDKLETIRMVISRIENWAADIENIG